jgi:hypothetical protein
LVLKKKKKTIFQNAMVDFPSVVNRALEGATTGTTAPTTDGVREAARLFLYDVTHTVRWHAVAAGVALAATPLVFQLSRMAAQRYRAELVSAAKDAVQREELFNGAEADGVMIDPADEGGIVIAYNTLSRARRQHNRNTIDDRDAYHSNNGEGSSSSVAGESPSLWSTTSATAASTLAMRVGRRHSWVISSFAHHILAAQRAPNVQFVRTCSRAAVCQYSVFVLRACTANCVLCVAALSATHVCCAALDKVVPMTSGSGAAAAAAGSNGESTFSVGSLLRSFVAAPLFDTAMPPSPSVSCTYGLCDFSVSARGVWSRLIPKVGALQTWYQRLFGFLQPMHAEWRDGVGDVASSSSTADARADAVWAALTPRGFFCVMLLSRLPRRLLDGFSWGRGRVVNAVMRRWYDVTTAQITTSATASASSSLPHPHTSPRPPPQPSKKGGKGTPPKEHKRLVHAPLVIAASVLASDVAFAGLVFLATSLVSKGGGGSAGGGPRPLVRSAAGARYNVYCWVEAVTSVVTLAVL